MEWYLYFGMIGFLCVAFSVFLGIAFNSIQKVRNHYRYHKMRPGERSQDVLEKTRPVSLKILIPLAFFLAWCVVHFLIFR